MSRIINSEGPRGLGIGCGKVISVKLFCLTPCDLRLTTQKIIVMVNPTKVHITYRILWTHSNSHLCHPPGQVVIFDIPTLKETTRFR